MDNQSTRHLTTSHEIELLAPAGGLAAFRAALVSGADAIYMGIDKLNARRNADNFKLEDLKDVTRAAHLSGVRVYLTLNIIIRNEELQEALDVVHDAYLSGIDGFIVQDWGLLAEIHAAYPQVELHISTQANVHDVQGVRFAKDLGAKRVTTSRELSLRELKTLSQQGVDIEAFGHGALCICYSGQCLMSSLIGRRSANRGMCAQPCRLTYQLVDQNGQVVSTVAGEHLLSPKDLSTIDILPDLIESGVTSLKVEGRMKSPEYVGLVVGTYRKALDRALKDPANYRATQEERDILTEAFSRGFTTAYMQGERGNDMMSYQRPNNRGIQVARVSRLEGGWVTLSAEKDLALGDVLEYWTGRGRFAEEIKAFDNPNVTAVAAGKKARIKVSKPVAPGDRVFRVRNARLLKIVDEAVAHAYVRPILVDVQVKAEIGQPLAITLSDNDGHIATATGAVVEPARTKALTTEDIREHVGRFGSTPFVPQEWDIRLDEGVGMGFSALHKVRAHAAELLEEEILAPWLSRSLPQRGATLSDILFKQTRPSQEKPLITALVTSPEAARQALFAGAGLVYASADAIEQAQKEGTPFPDETVILLDEVTHDKDLKRMEKIITPNRRYAAANVSHLRRLSEEGLELEVWNTIPAVNPSVLAFLVNQGARALWLSPELSLADLKTLVPRLPVPTGIVVSGRQQVMVSEHCFLMSMGPCDEVCTKCERRRTPKYLRDRKDYEFPVHTDNHGRCHIYNAVPLDITPELPDLLACNISRFMVDATLLTPQETFREVKHAAGQLARALSGQELQPRPEGRTAGHIFRGIL